MCCGGSIAVRFAFWKQELPNYLTAVLLLRLLHQRPGIQDLKKKAKLREKFAVEDDWVLPYEVIPIIDIPEFGDKAAVKVPP